MEFLNNDCEVQGLIRAAFITFVHIKKNIELIGAYENDLKNYSIIFVVDLISSLEGDSECFDKKIVANYLCHIYGLKALISCDIRCLFRSSRGWLKKSNTP
ncbi:hypothetical protein ACJX0J_026305 [Zea mays]